MHKHVIREYNPDYEAAYVSNGLIGLRIGQLPFPGGTALVNGVMGISPEKGCEELAEAIYPVGADICINNVWLSARPTCMRFVEQSYDFSCGELRSVFDFTVDTITARVETVVFCSRTSPTLTLQQTTVSVDKPCMLVLQGHLDFRGVAGTLLRTIQPGTTACVKRRDSDGLVLWETRGGLSSFGAAYVCEYVGENGVRRRNDYGHEQDLLLTQHHIEANPGCQHTMQQYGSLVPGSMHSEPHFQAHRFATYARDLTFESMRADNRAAWAELWKGRVRVVGASERWQHMIDAAHFYIHSSIHRSCQYSVAPFGLSQRCAYSGHIFWDTETFIFPASLLTAPDTARAMLEYRTRMIPAARNNALLCGYEGIQFPWQSGLTGCEVTPYYCSPGAGISEQFINPCVAFAFWQYMCASGDDRFRQQQGWPVIEGVAEWICSRVRKTTRGYEIHNVVGNDESVHNVNNHALTNGLCARILREGVRLAEKLGMTPPPHWREVAEGIFLSVNAKTGAIEKHENDAEHLTKASPDSLELLLFPFECASNNHLLQASVKHQLSLAHTYLGMPMHSSYFSVWAARMGDRKLSMEFLEQGMAPRFIDPYFQFIESSKPGNPWANRTPVFLSGLAGLLNACIMGFPGISLDEGAPENWGKHPVILPDGWESIEVERIFARGKPMSLSAHQGADRALIIAR